MPNKPAYTVTDQVQLLKSRGMLFRDEAQAANYLKNISYYRFKGYWWDMQADFTLHTLKPNTWFEDIIDRYNFDRHLRLILFDALERIEIALRTKMIYYLSISYGRLWYLDSSLFENTTVTLNDGTVKTVHQNTLDELKKEVNRSQEIFMKDHRNRYPNKDADAWKTMVYLCNEITPKNQIKTKILELIKANPKIPIYRLGFQNNWEKEPLWQ